MKKKQIPEFYIFFMNLNNPLAEEGKLNFAKGYYMHLDKDPKNYEYPFTVYTKPLNVEGVEVKHVMNIADINKKRKAVGVEKIKYYDEDMNDKNEAGSTTTLSNGYFTTFDGFSTQEEQKKANFYNIMYRQTEGQIEYIRIVHDTGQDYFKY